MRLAVWSIYKENLDLGSCLSLRLANESHVDLVDGYGMLETVFPVNSHVILCASSANSTH